MALGQFTRGAWAPCVHMWRGEEGGGGGGGRAAVRE